MRTVLDMRHPWNVYVSECEAKEARLVAQLTTVSLTSPTGNPMGTVRVFVKPGGVRDYRPEATEHWTKAELAAWRAWDRAHYHAELVDEGIRDTRGRYVTCSMALISGGAL